MEAECGGNDDDAHASTERKQLAFYDFAKINGILLPA